MSPVALSEEAEAIAQRVAELLRSTETGTRLIDVAAAAKLLGTSTTFIYEHKWELGAVRLGKGPKAPLRFDPARLTATPPAPSPPGPPPKPTPRRQPGTGATDLLPVRGRA